MRVWNDGLIRAKTGFPPHPHRDMEIITYVREGAITHRDHLNNEGRTVAGDVQVMSAGRGIRHEEWNLEDEDTRIFQIWIEPNRQGVTPRWETATFPKDGRKGRLVPLASGRRDAAAETLVDRAGRGVLGASLDAGTEVTHLIGKGRLAYLVPARGRVEVNGIEVSELLRRRDPRCRNAHHPRARRCRDRAGGPAAGRLGGERSLHLPLVGRSKNLKDFSGGARRRTKTIHMPQGFLPHPGNPLCESPGSPQGEAQDRE